MSKKLFVVGNGFDCYLHGFPTKYSDFRKSILNQYRGIDKKHIGIITVPIGYEQADGGIEYDLDDIAMFIVDVLDACDDENWSDLEHYLGCEIYQVIGEQFIDNPDFEEDDQVLKMTEYNNEDDANRIRAIFGDVKSLFVDWVNTEIAGLNFDGKSKDSVKDIIAGESLFLNFNYSKTLETGYAVDTSNICHIHGVVGDKAEEIILGHGDREDCQGYYTFEILNTLSELKDSLRKDTDLQIKKHKTFFEQLNDVDKVYSYGFSFSDVDMPYIEQIKKSTEDGVTWYLDQFEWSHDGEKEKSTKNRLKTLGFKVCVENRW